MLVGLPDTVGFFQMLTVAKDLLKDKRRGETKTTERENLRGLDDYDRPPWDNGTASLLSGSS